VLKTYFSILAAPLVIHPPHLHHSPLFGDPPMARRQKETLKLSSGIMSMPESYPGACRSCMLSLV